MKRFYQHVTTAPSEQGYQILLDDKPVRTPLKNTLTLPSLALADWVRAEWEAQEETIQPSNMPATGLAHAVLDALPTERANVIAELAAFGDTDLLYYRAPEQALAERQGELWDPVLDWARAAWGVEFAVTEGIMPIAQEETTLNVLRAAIEKIDNWRLAGFTILVHKLGSLLLALAVLHEELSWKDACAASRVDEHFQAATWGEDEELLARAKATEKEIADAAQFISWSVN